MKLYHTNIKEAFSYLANFSSSKKNVESIYFYTFHKCASILFSNYVLKNIDGLQHVDYARYLWDKPNNFKKNLKFKKKGCIYGPLRLSARGELVHNLLISPTSNPEFTKDKTAIFFIRDPRDILVSAYFSFGFTHPLNPVEEKKRKQLILRNEIQSLSVDEYVLKFANQQIEYFNNLRNIANNCARKVILKYEDMIENFDSFIGDFKTITNISDEVLQTFYEKSRPKKNINNNSHRRSGTNKRYLKDLKPETIELINKKLEVILNDFEYNI